MSADRELDALVIGAGFAGLTVLHRLRALGLRVRAYDAAGDVGGTWWWHYYPGARLDTEAPVYQYLVPDDRYATLYEQWGWSERYPAGYEVQRWLRFVADRLDLRRDIALRTRVVEAAWDDEQGRWTVRTDHGETISTRFVVACTGLLPAERTELPGTFAGLVMDTARWPERYPDLTGRKVGVVGTGTVGAQLVERLVGEVGHLTLFAERLSLVLPRANPHYGWQEREAYRSRFTELVATVPHTATGDDHDPPHVGAGRTPAEREALLARALHDGSQDPVRATFRDVGTDRDVAGAVSAFVGRAMRERLADDRLADLVVPTGHDVATRPVPLESGYLDAARHVPVVTAPIARLRPEGVELADGTVHELDVVALTDEFDAGPPALTRVDVRGRDGRVLTAGQEWTLGLAAPGFPNLLSTAIPSGPRCTRSTLLQAQAGWIVTAIRAAGASGRLEAGAGSGTEPEPVDDVGAYHRRCTEEAEAGYPSFVRW